MKRFEIICDTREKKPFQFYDRFGNLIECRHQKLNTGDYSLVGLEDLICIERKKTVTELAGNVVSKRFIKELERMKQYKYKYLVLEFSLKNILGYPENQDLPWRIKNKIKVSGEFILTRICQWSLDYEFEILPCDNRFKATNMVFYILNRIFKQEKINV